MTNVKFAAFTDLHSEIMHDAPQRLQKFICYAEKENVDFIIQLGDLGYPEPAVRCDCQDRRRPINLSVAMTQPYKHIENMLTNQLKSLSIPIYHVLGNHEMDFSSKSSVIDFDGIPSPFYSFEFKSWHFIVLDGNHYRNYKGKIVDYSYGDYFSSDDLPYLGDTQLDWLAVEMNRNNNPVVLFCHQPLWECERGLKDRSKLMSIINSAYKHGKHVKLCMNGHLHRDLLVCDNHIIYYSLNSMSNYWAGELYNTKRFSEITECDYPNLRYTLPYRDPLFAIITLNDKGIMIKGTKSRFVQPGPKTMRIKPMPTARIKDRCIPWL
ncbi:MAG: metallophosphoesterase [Clostridia bacterium]|nr:metallophosphoesterase [Clostridia bacterium]